MNIFFKDYYDDSLKPSKKYFSSKDWKQHGFAALRALYHYCGCPALQNLNHLEDYFEFNTYKKGVQIVTAGIPCRKIYFVISGKIRTHTLDEQGNPRVRCIFNDGNVTTGVESFFDGEETLATTEALTNLMVLELTKENYLRLKSRSDFFDIFNSLIQKRFVFQMEFEKIHSYPATEKVKILYKKYPQLFTNFFNKDVAALLGLQKETFCRIKKQLGIA